MRKHFQVGIIVGAHGLRGEVKVYPTTDVPDRFTRLEYVFLSDKKISGSDFDETMLEKVKICDAKQHKNLVILRLEGVEDRDQALRLKDRLLIIEKKDAIKVDADQYFFDDILDCRVVDEKKGDLGYIIDIIPTGSNDVYMIKSDKYGDFMIPAIRDVVKKVDPINKKIEIVLMKGLLDDEV